MRCPEPHCNRPIPSHVAHCPTCGCYIGPPNVRTASEPQEADALRERYVRARACAETRDCLPVVDEFETAMADSCCVINVDLDFLYSFLRENGHALYSTYRLGVTGQMRKPAQPDDDRTRSAAEGLLFGSYGAEIRYGALSLDGKGLISYGPFAMQLREVAVAKRASVLEENSYDFTEHHQLTPKAQIPRGYRAPWANRHLLGVAKLACDLQQDTRKDEFPGTLLSSTGDRAMDKFIEVHIYGPFDANAVQAVRGSSTPAFLGDLAQLDRVKEWLGRIGADWVEDA